MSNRKSPECITQLYPTDRPRWNSPLLKPLPRKLERDFDNVVETQSANAARLFNEKNDDESADEKFQTYAAVWAAQDRERLQKERTLEDLEDCMEETMHLADKILRLICIIKKQIKKL